MNKLSNDLKNLVAPTERMLIFIWIGQFGTLGIYTFIAFQSPNTAESIQQTPPVFVFVAAAIACMVISLLLRRYILSSRGVVRFLNDEMPAWYYIAFKSQVSKRKEIIAETLDETEQKLFGYASRTLNIQMILWGMLNTTALLGMILSMMINQRMFVLYFVVPVFLVILTQFPDLVGLLDAGLIEKDLSRRQA